MLTPQMAVLWTHTKVSNFLEVSTVSVQEPLGLTHVFNFEITFSFAPCQLVLINFQCSTIMAFSSIHSTRQFK